MVREAFKNLFGLRSKKILEKMKNKPPPPKAFCMSNDMMNFWRKPCELVRDSQDFTHMHHWKMREAHDALFYNALALANSKAIRDLLQPISDTDLKIDGLLDLIVGLRLIYCTSHECPSKADLDTAATLLRSFFDHTREVYTNHVITYKLHCILHLVEEVRYHGAHLGSFDAYPFENFLGWFRKHLIKHGKCVLRQCVNNLRRIQRYKIGGSLFGANSDATLDIFVPGKVSMSRMQKTQNIQLIKKFKTLSIPAQVILKARKGVLRCHGMTIKTTYPDNIVLLRRSDTLPNYKGNRKVDIFVVSDIDVDKEEKVILKGKKFRKWKPGFSRYGGNYKFPSGKNMSHLGVYEAALTGLDKDTSAWGAKEFLVGKCFPFHMEEAPLKDEHSPLSSGCRPDQWWTFVRLMHTGPSQFL